MNNEPVAWRNLCVGNIGEDSEWIYNEIGQGEPLYTHPVKELTLTNEEILCLWDWWSGEVLATDIIDFADTYKRVLLGEKGLLEWHKEYVKKMNEKYPSGKVTEK